MRVSAFPDALGFVPQHDLFGLIERAAVVVTQRTLQVHEAALRD